MDFSFYLPCYWPDTSVPARKMYGEMLEQAVAAETLGFATLAIPEDHFLNYLTHPNPLMTAIKVASVTERIPLITAVLVLPFFDMRRLAGEIAQADCLTDGRIQLGVGRGAFRYEFDRFGVAVDESREKFDDSLALLETLLTEEEVSWDSTYYKVRCADHYAPPAAEAPPANLDRRSRPRCDLPFRNEGLRRYDHAPARPL